MICLAVGLSSQYLVRAFSHIYINELFGVTCGVRLMQTEIQFMRILGRNLPFFKQDLLTMNFILVYWTVRWNYDNE